jgi:predicted nucleic acid-binding protein
MILLDTSVVIEYPDKPFPMGDLAFSAITYAELSFGIAIQSEPQIRAHRQFRLSLLDRVGIEWLPFDQHAAAGYAEIARYVHIKRPQHSRSKDIMLAGQAYALGASLATLNPKDFELISDLVEIIIPS